MSAETIRTALKILRDNDRGEFSVPTHGLYPVQFNWDSAFASLGYVLTDPKRAFREVELLLEAQWAGGMVPHIIFRGGHDGYFPGPDVWGTGQPIPTSGITQPPVAASIMRRLVENGVSLEPERLKRSVERLERWHHWFTQARQCAETGAIFVVHPWESGRDNLTDWDAAMDRIEPDTGIGDYKRRDLEHVNAAQRPTKREYDRYLTILHHGRKIGWNQEEMGRTSPFRMIAPCMTAILLRSERDLIWLQGQVGIDASATKARAQRLEAGWKSLWNPTMRAFTSRDPLTGEFHNSITAASFLGPYAGVIDHLSETLDHFDRIAKIADYMIPSYDPECLGFDPKCYWRGPVWAVMNNRIGLGLSEIGEYDRAERIRNDTARLCENSQFYEYFNPLSGEGLGGKVFTWTSSVYLDWAADRTEVAAVLQQQ